jgi:DNA-binding response OmpR family regulator
MLLDTRDPANRIDIDIVVVDPHQAGYADWARSTPARVALCTTAGEALELSSSKPALWVIHAELPDLSGLELHSKLRSLGRQETSLLVTEFYDAAQELAALSQGNLIYCAKPLDFVQLRRLWEVLMVHLAFKRPQAREELLPAQR